MCEFLIWLMLTAVPTCEGWKPEDHGCTYKVQPRECIWESSVVFDAEERKLTITGPNDVATFVFVQRESGWQRFRFVEQGRAGQLESIDILRWWH